MARFSLHDRKIDRERVIAVAGVVAIHAGLGWALLYGLGVSPVHLVQSSLETFDLTAPEPVPPPLPPVEKPKAMPERSGRASPPNLKSKATPVVAPTPEVRLPIPPLIVAAPTPAAGAEATSGYSDRPGPGTGSGGIGDGTGSGGYGDGPGGGGGGGTPAYPINRDLGSLDCGAEGSTCRDVEITLRFTVGVDGRASGCRVIRPSGDGQADRESCPRAERRLRFRPERDARGRKVPVTITWVHEFDRRPDLDIPADDRD